MHDSSERRPGAGRPSLLSKDQAPAQEDHSVLSKLDGRAAPARRTPARKPDHQRGARAVVFGVAIAGIATLAWLALGSVSETADETLAAAHAPAPLPAMPTAAPVDAAPPAPSAATIHDDLTAALDAPATKELPGATEAASVSPAAAQAGHRDLERLLDAPAAAPAPSLKLAAAATAETARKDGAGSKPVRSEKPRTPAPAPKPKVVQKPAAQKPPAGKPAPVDSDVALLAALLAHTKTPEAGSPEEIYKRCATNATAAEVQRCRVRVCQGSAKGAAECKSVRISKVSS